MQRTFHFPIAFGHSATRLGIVFAIYLLDFTGGILFTACAFYYVRRFETDFLTGCHTEIFLGWILHEIFPFDIKFPCKRHRMHASLRFLGIILRIEIFDLIFGIIGYNKFDRIHYGSHPIGILIKVFPNAMFEQCDIDKTVEFGIPYLIYKIAYRLGCISATTQPAQSRHTGIVPARNEFFLNQL